MNESNKNRYLFYEYILRTVPESDVVYAKAFAYAGPNHMMDFCVCTKI